MKTRLEQDAPCPRFTKHKKNYEKREYISSGNFDMFQENETEAPRDSENNTDLNNEATAVESVIDLAVQSQVFQEEEPVSKQQPILSETLVTPQLVSNSKESLLSNSLPNISYYKPAAQMRPKNQTVSSNFFKLPSLTGATKPPP
jgi:hypothetical protein